jgi:hypothetical protein
MNYKVLVPLFAITLLLTGIVTHNVTKPALPYSAESAEVDKIVESMESEVEVNPVKLDVPESEAFNVLN